jgi:hypothetical protein
MKECISPYKRAWWPAGVKSTSSSIMTWKTWKDSSKSRKKRIKRYTVAENLTLF